MPIVHPALRTVAATADDCFVRPLLLKLSLFTFLEMQYDVITRSYDDAFGRTHAFAPPKIRVQLESKSNGSRTAVESQSNGS